VIPVPRIAVLLPVAVMFGIGIGHAQSARTPEAPRTPPKQSAVVASAETKHLTVRATLSDNEVAPGARISLTLDITPKHGMHVYAPGGKYAPLTLEIPSQPFVTVHDAVYPPAEDFFFAPLNDHAQVYSEPFRLVRDVTIGDRGDRSTPTAMPSRLTVKGTLEYQACDDRFCYLRTSIPLQWTLKIKR
jgi:DsbC/DsbD-like thiol-disulfide interchange protein